MKYSVLYWFEWLWIMVCYTEPVVINHGVLYWAVVVNHGVYCWASDCESWWVLLCQWWWIMMCYAESVVVNNAVLCLWIRMSCTVPVAVNRGFLYCASGCESCGVMLWDGCESCCAMLSQWLWTMVSYDQPVVVNHGVLFWASGYVSWCFMLSQWLWIKLCYSEPASGSKS